MFSKAADGARGAQRHGARQQALVADQDVQLAMVPEQRLRIVPVARRILDALDLLREGLLQAIDQIDRQADHRHLGDVIEDDVARLGPQPHKHRGNPVEQPLVAAALEVERRRQQEARTAQHQPGAALGDRILDRGGGDADHELAARIDRRTDQGAQRALAVVLPQRGALARGAEDRDAGATVGQRLAGVRHQARQVDRPVFGKGRGEGDGKTEAVRAERQVRFP